MPLDPVEEIWVQEILERSFTLSKKGYAIIYVPGHPWASRSGQMHRYRYIMNVLGRLTDKALRVHHRDRVKLNDHPDNLEVMTHESHSLLHASLIPLEQIEKIRAGLNQYYDRNRREIGQAMPESRIQALSEKHLGIRLSEEAKAKLSAANKGRKITWGDKISEALKAKGIKPPSELARLANTGRKLTPEQRESAMAASRRRWAAARPILQQRTDEWIGLKYLGARNSDIARAYEVSPATVTRVLKELPR